MQFGLGLGLARRAEGGDLGEADVGRQRGWLGWLQQGRQRL
jgi:hypothetical protein